MKNEPFLVFCKTCNATLVSTQLIVSKRGLVCPLCDSVLFSVESIRYKEVLDHRRAGGK